MSAKHPLIHPETVPISGLNPLFDQVSPPRQAMMTGMLSQINIVAGSNRKRFRSGLEREHAKGTYKHMFDEDCTVLAVIPRFANKFLMGRNGVSPMHLVIYENYETNQLGCVELTTHHIMHQHYGFKYRFDEEIMDKLLQPGARFEAGTVIADSPNVTPDGDYMLGMEANVCFFTDAAGSEDGLVYSESHAKRMSPTGIEKRVFGCGRSHYPINVNGNAEVFKAIPELGDPISPTGLIAAFRPLDEILNPVYMTQRRLLTPVYGMDQPLYGHPGAKVIDIKVYRNEQVRESRIPPEFTEQFVRYWEAEKHYYMQVIKTCLKRSGRKYLDKDVNLHPDLWTVVYNGLAYCGTDLVAAGLWPEDDADRLKRERSYRGESMDEWRVELTFEYQVNIAEGPKQSNLHAARPFYH